MLKNKHVRGLNEDLEVNIFNIQYVATNLVEDITILLFVLSNVDICLRYCDVLFVRLVGFLAWLPLQIIFLLNRLKNVLVE